MSNAPIFKVRYTGDYLDEDGQLVIRDIALDLLDTDPSVEYSFLAEHQPTKNERTYWDRLYSLEVEPKHVAAANGIVIFRPWVKASAFANGADNLVVIGRAGAGYDKIDLPACTENDVAVFNAPDTLTHSTASSAFVLILALAKRLTEQERLVRQGRWDLQAQFMGSDLPGMTLGIIGFGHSGRELARLIAPFQMRLIAYSPSANPQQAAALNVELVSTMDDLMRQADFVSLHCRLLPTNHGLIGERELRLMKPTAYFINVARGELVQQEVLVRSLKERWIAGAGLDVYEHEPLPITNPLLQLDNVILTPHWLPATRQAARATMSQMAQGMLRAAHGKVPENIINPAVLERPRFKEKLARYRAG